MSGTKEAELVTAVLLYAMRCVAEGDQSALRGLSCGPREIEALRTLSLADLYRVGPLQAHCLDIRLSRDVFWPMLRHLQGTREAEEQQRDLIQHDAPLEMMRTLFGMGSREYTRLRRMLSVAPGVGRPPEPDELTAHALWRAVAARCVGDSEATLPADAYLELHRETGASLRAIWSAVQRWFAEGDGSESDADCSGDERPGTTALKRPRPRAA